MTCIGAQSDGCTQRQPSIFALLRCAAPYYILPLMEPAVHECQIPKPFVELLLLFLFIFLFYPMYNNSPHALSGATCFSFQINENFDIADSANESGMNDERLSI